MKRPLLLLLLIASALPSIAQQEAIKGIKVTSTLHDDGSRTDLQTDYDSLTAESKTYNASKKLIERATFTINEEGKTLEGVIYNAKGQIANRVAYTYDEQGRRQEEMNLDANGNLLRRLVYHYGANGKVSGIDAYDSRGNLLQPSGPAPSTSESKKKTSRPPSRK